jgi:hypothetical protein
MSIVFDFEIQFRFPISPATVSIILRGSTHLGALDPPDAQASVFALNLVDQVGGPESNLYN